MLNVEIVLKTNFNPTEKHLSDLKNWLIDEWNTTNKGFYSNWEMIPEAFTDKRLSVITENDYAIGFVVYRTYDLTAVIDIAEIKSDERKKGYAKKLINGTLEFFKSKGILAVQLFCSPENSEPFWKRIGFLNFPEIPYQSRINMYKTLVDTLNTSQEENAESTIKLWNCEPYQANGIEPNWVWNLSFLEDNATLVKPIIFPAYKDWQIELTKSNGTIKSDKIKYCGIDLADYGSFMIIRKVNI